jgi:hypothetical protein
VQMCSTALCLAKTKMTTSKAASVGGLFHFPIKRDSPVRGKAEAVGNMGCPARILGMARDCWVENLGALIAERPA